VPQDSSKSLRDTLLIPIVVGIVIAIATYFLPKLFEKGREVSYTVDGPTTYITQQMQGVVVTVNGTPVPTLFITRVRIWNSGKDALENLPVLLFFPTGSKDFKVLSAAHETQPEHEFGKVAEEAPDYQSRKYTYQLLNPNDADTITLLTNDPARPSVYSKAEGLRTKAVARAENRGFERWSVFLTLAANIAAALLAIVFFRVSSQKEAERRARKLEELRSEIAHRIAAEEAHLARQRDDLEEKLRHREKDLDNREAQVARRQDEADEAADKLKQRAIELEDRAMMQEAEFQQRKAAGEAILVAERAKAEEKRQQREMELQDRAMMQEAEFQQRKAAAEAQLATERAEIDEKLRQLRKQT
jgi:hypothetical protein